MGKNATSPLHSRGSLTNGAKSKWAHKWAEVLHHPCILGGPQQRGQNQSGRTSGCNCYITPAFSGVPKERGTKSEVAGSTSGHKCYITAAFSGVPNKGDKIKRGPQVGGNATSPLHSRGSPKKGGQIQIWMPNPCLLGGPQMGGNAKPPLHSGGSPKKGGRNQNWMPNLCLLGDPHVGGNATSPLHSRGSPTKGIKSKQKKGKKKTKTKNVPWCP